MGDIDTPCVERAGGRETVTEARRRAAVSQAMEFERDETNVWINEDKRSLGFRQQKVPLAVMKKGNARRL
jgi:hypothetical protein